MPSWCRNKIMVGSREKMDELVKAHCPIDKELGTPEMDFNTIRRMPDDLQIEYGSKSHDGLRLLFTRLSPAVSYYGSKEDKMTDDDYEKLVSSVEDHCWDSVLQTLSKPELQALKEKYKGSIADVEALGEKCVENLRKYGAMNWYEWSIQNWGTKWNATDTVIDGSSMTFSTAWDPALPAVVEMSRLHPTMPMALLFADEQTGAGVGYALMKGGKIDDSGSFKDFSVDAYKLAFNVWGNGDEYTFDPVRKTYMRKDLLQEN